MPYSLERFDSLGYVIVRHHGYVVPEEVEDIFNSIHASNLDGAELPDLIVDLRRCETYLTQGQIFNSLSNFHHRPRGVRRSAFVTDGAFMREAKFIELASENRGIPTKVFADESEALEWFGIEPG